MKLFAVETHFGTFIYHKHTQYVNFTSCKIQMILCCLSSLYFQYENLPACVSKLMVATSDIHCKMYCTL